MKNGDVKKLSFEDISLHAQPHSIKNFILSYNISNPPNLNFREPFIFDGVTLGLCLKGKGLLLVDSKKHEISPNTLFMLFPHHLIKLSDKSEDFSIITLFFSYDFVLENPFLKKNEGISAIGKSFFFELTAEENENLIEMYSYMLKQYNRVDHMYREDMMKAQLYTFLLEVSFIMNKNQYVDQKKTTNRQEEIVERLFSLLIENFKKERTVSFYANKMCLSPKYLSSVIKKATGHSLSKWVNELILIEAKRLLKTSDMTILQVSEKLNFPNPSFFGRFFKENVGVTPLKYKNEGIR